MTEGAAPIRLAVIGTGAISQIFHVPVFAEREDVDLVALVDTDVRKVETIARRFEIEEVIDPEEAVDREGRYYPRVMGWDGSGSLPPLEIDKQLGGRPLSHASAAEAAWR